MAKSTSFGDSIQQLIGEGLRARASKMFDEQKAAMVEEFAERLERERETLIAATALRVMSTFNAHQSSDHLIITVEAPKAKHEDIQA